MKIGILGTRGIPNAYGGFEQFAQHLAIGLTERAHDVYVYNSSDHPYKEREWRGVSIIHCKDWEGKIGTAGQFIYDYNCLSDARSRQFDILLQLGYTSNSIWYWKWPEQAVNIVNMDGLEWKRNKYNKPTRKFLRLAERLAVKHADILISDSIGIRDYIKEKYQKQSVYIPYGAEIPVSYDPSALNKWNLKPFSYFLIIARLEPENNVEMLIQGYLQSAQPYPLLILGNPANRFGQYLQKKYKHEKVKFQGAVYDKHFLDNLRHFSALYFHGHSVGGTNPSLLEAMACKSNIAAHANIFNQAILDRSADYFSTSHDVHRIIDSPPLPDVVQQRKELNIQKIEKLYNWNTVIEGYEKVFLEARNIER